MQRNLKDMLEKPLTWRDMVSGYVRPPVDDLRAILQQVSDLNHAWERQEE